MAWRISIALQESPPVSSGKSPLLLQAIPPTGWFQHVCASRYINARVVGELTAVHTNEHAVLLEPSHDRQPVIEQEIEPIIAPPPESLWQQLDNRFTRVAGILADTARATIGTASSTSDQVRALVEHAAARFEYGHVEQRFNDGKQEMPLVCGTTKGSCVDMHGYVMAMAHAVGIKVQYLAGYWFHPDKSETHDMHCWLVFLVDGEAVYWDLAHHLKWGVTGLAPGLNPAGGRRVLMSYGRGLTFHTPYGSVETSHFSEPLWVLPDGSTQKPAIRVSIVD